MKNTLFTIVFTALLTSAAGFVYNCSNEDCSSCPSVENCERTIKCGCCKICVELIKEGETCISPAKIVLQTHMECDSGLLCNPFTEKCTEDHSFLEQLQEKKPSHNGSVICHNNMCYCSFEGEILTGYLPLPYSHLTAKSCNCALQKAKFMKTKLIGKMYMCTKTGSFENLQCTGSVCHCVDDSGKQLNNSEPFPVTEIDGSQC